MINNYFGLGCRASRSRMEGSCQTIVMAVARGAIASATRYATNSRCLWTCVAHSHNSMMPMRSIAQIWMECKRIALGSSASALRWECKRFALGVQAHCARSASAMRWEYVGSYARAMRAMSLCNMRARTRYAMIIASDGHYATQ